MLVCDDGANSRREGLELHPNGSAIFSFALRSLVSIGAIAEG